MLAFIVTAGEHGWKEAFSVRGRAKKEKQGVSKIEKREIIVLQASVAGEKLSVSEEQQRKRNKEYQRKRRQK